MNKHSLIAYFFRVITRHKIMQCAIELFKEKGYENTSVADICRAAGITKGTFYYHFPNKDEISFEFYENMFSDFTGEFPELLAISNAKDQLWKIYEYSIDRTIALGPKLLCSLYMSDIQKGLSLFSPYSSYDLDTQSSRQIRLQIEIVKKGQKTGEIRSGDPVMMVRTFIAALAGIALAWSSNNAPFDEKEELRKAFDIIF